jgi:hypothetical protein
MVIENLQRDIKEASKLLDAICATSKIFCELELNTLSDREVIKRAEAIHWSLLMYCNDVTAMVGQWSSELESALYLSEENSNSQPTGNNGKPQGEITPSCETCLIRRSVCPHSSGSEGCRLIYKSA